MTGRITPAMHTALRTLAEAFPAGAGVSVPREILLELLQGEPADQTPAQGAADATVREVALRFGRSPSTIREWCEQGLLPGCYKLRFREWRIPAAALKAFQDAERSAGRSQLTGRPSRQRGQKVRHLTRLLGKPA